MDFYGVKLFFEIEVTGEPDEGARDEFFDEKTRFYEESVYLVRANSADGAFAEADKLAGKTNESYLNKYGQKVKRTLYDSVECYKLFSEPESGVEVFSTCFALEEGENLEQVIEERYSSCSEEEVHKLLRA